jgi:hypothetical protein
LLEEHRKAVSTDSPQQFVEWFSLKTVLVTLTNQLLSSGILYDILSFEDIDKLQGFFSFHCDLVEARINYETAEQRSSFDKQKAAQAILFWETSFRKQQANLEAVIEKLENQ